MSLPRTFRRLGAVTVTAALAVGLVAAATPSASARPPASSGLSGPQRAQLLAIARDTWRFFDEDVDPNTHLPLDNVWPGKTRGDYTPSANVGTYLWAVTSAYDLHVINR